MEATNQPESGFKIINLLLMDSSFHRVVTVNFDEAKNENIINIDVNVQIYQNDTVAVTETLNYTRKFEQKEEVSAQIVMVGVFEKIGTTSVDLEEFGNVNGAAIIFPFIREHLSNMSSKAGIGLILLPPFNFTKKKS